MSLYTHLIAVAISALVAFYGGYTVRDNSAKETELQIAQTYADSLRASQAQEQAWQSKYIQGVSDAREREKKLAAEAVAAGRTAASLRNTVAGLQQRLSESSAEACRHYVGTLSDVLGECSERYRTVAGVADQCVSDVQTLTEAWPQ